MIASLVTGALLAALAGFAATAGLSRLEPGHGRAAECLGASLLGALLVLAPALASPDVLTMAGYVLFGSCALVLAHIDRETSWAPDPPVFGLLLAVVLLALPAGTQSLARAGFALVAALGAFAILQLGWLVLRLLRLEMPPADILALLLPVLLFGVSFWAALAWLLLGLSLALLKLVPRWRRLVMSEAVQARFADEGLGSTQNPAIPLLALALPLAILMVNLAFFCGERLL